MKVISIINRKDKLEKEIKEHIKKHEEQGLYTIFNSNYAKKIIKQTKDYSSKNIIYQTIKECDEKCAVPNEVGEHIESLLENNNITLGIHRTKINDNVQSDMKLNSILKEGLKNYGDLSSGIIYDNPELSKTISFPNNILNTMILLKNSYKESTGGFLLVFPSAIVTKNGDLKEENYETIYQKINGTNYIKSEYILGYIDNKYGVINYYPKEELIKTKKNTR